MGVETPPQAPQRGTFLSSLYSPLPLTILAVTVFPAFLWPSRQQDHGVQGAGCCRDRPTIGKAGFQTRPAKLAAYSVGSGLLSVKWGYSQTQSAWISEKSHGWLQITCCFDLPPPPPRLTLLHVCRGSVSHLLLPRPAPCRRKTAVAHTS